MLSPQTRKHSPATSKSSPPLRVARLVAKTGFISNNTTLMQRRFLHSQRAKDQAQRIRDITAERAADMSSKTWKGLMATIMKQRGEKRAGSKVKGIWDRQKRQMKAERKRKKREVLTQGPLDQSLETSTEDSNCNETKSAVEPQAKESAVTSSASTLSSSQSDAGIQEVEGTDA